MPEPFSITCLVPPDVDSLEDRQRLVDEAGDVDIWVNNAGAAQSGTLHDQDMATLRNSLELKLFGYLELSRLVMPGLEQRGGGVVMNVIGTAGLRSDERYIAGAIANSALDHVTTALGANSWRTGVRVVGVHPGLTLTPRMETMLRAAARRRGEEEAWQDLMPTQPPPGTPEQVADVVTFLCSPRASHVTGTVIAVDGGWSAQPVRT